jgi:hypothetical protein
MVQASTSLKLQATVQQATQKSDRLSEAHITEWVEGSGVDEQSPDSLSNH